MTTRNWKTAERKSNWFKWQNVNDSVEGKLLTNETRESKYKDNDGNAKQERVISIERDEGDTVQMSCPSDLAARMEDIRPGAYVCITYTGTKDVKGGAMKVFSVVYDDGEAEGAPEPEPPPDLEEMDEKMPF